MVRYEFRFIESYYIDVYVQLSKSPGSIAFWKSSLRPHSSADQTPKKPSPLTRVPVLYKACFSSYEVTLYCGKASVIVRSIWHQRRLSVSPGQRGGAIGSVCPW